MLQRALLAARGVAGALPGTLGVAGRSTRPLYTTAPAAAAAAAAAHASANTHTTARAAVGAAATSAATASAAPPVPSITELFHAGVHLGHKPGLRHPRMDPYIYGEQSGLQIIDLVQTVQQLDTALAALRTAVHNDAVILFVNTRPQFEKLVRKTAISCGEFFVTKKWVGGTLTNCTETLGANRLPDLLIFTSAPVNAVAIKEARDCRVPTIGIADTDCDPGSFTFPIVGNDDTPAALELYLKLFHDTIQSAKAERLLK